MTTSKKTMWFVMVCYMMLVATFMVLYCTFYTSVEGKPGNGEISISQSMKNPNLKFAISLTYVVLALYYLFFFLSLCNNLRLIMDLEKRMIFTFVFG